MRFTPFAPRLAPPPVRRVRHQARDAVALMVFSAAASVALTGLLLLGMDAGRG
jgi:hypothetical protein